MNYRERVLRTVRFEEVDQLPFRHSYGLMPGVLEEWHAQGLPQSVETPAEIYAYFGFPGRGFPLSLSVGFDPPFESRTVEETSEYRIAVDSMGRTTKLLKGYSTLPLALDFPVKDTHTWEDYKRRLRYHPSRVGVALEENAERNIENGFLNSFGAMGFYWFPRDLMGDEGLCMAFYDQPLLVKDILETWCSLIEQVLETALSRVRLDSVHFGEDMAYKNASMIGKNIFDEFLRPCYLRIARIVEKHRIPIFSVDTDGCLRDLVEWFAQCGVNMIGPNEVNAGNDIVAYRERMGRRMAYDGGLNKLKLLEGRSAIDEMLEGTIPHMKKSGGGWVVCLDHRVVKGTRLDDFQYYVNRVRELTMC